jgi:hypothetical protein
MAQKTFPVIFNVLNICHFERLSQKDLLDNALMPEHPVSSNGPFFYHTIAPLRRLQEFAQIYWIYGK